jgi:hypothetical protein
VEIAEEAAVAADVVAVRGAAVVAGRAGWAVILPPGRVVFAFAPVAGIENHTRWANRATRKSVPNVAPK